MIGFKQSNIRRVSDAESLISIAIRQGVVLNADEADMILGYLEGHDYCLMVDDVGATIRHDEQYGNDHSEDESYSIRDAIMFCQEMNDDLLHEEQDEDFLSKLRMDEQVLSTLMERRCCYARLSC